MQDYLLVLPDEVEESDGEEDAPLPEVPEPEVLEPEPEVLLDVSVLGVLDVLLLGVLVPLLGMLDELDPEVPLLEGVLLMELPLPEVPDVLVSVEEPELPMLPELLDPLPLPDEAPADEPLSLVVVVVVVLPDPLLPELPDGALEPADDASFDVSVVVVVVVVPCPNVAALAPMRARKMAKGNFFMLAPSNEMF